MEEVTTGTIELFLRTYAIGREAIDRACRDMTDDAIHWRGPKGQSVVTVGSLLYHLAGWDALVRSTLQTGSLQTALADGSIVSKYAQGFPRELSVPPPQIGSAESLLDMLRLETVRTIAFLERIKSNGDFSQLEGKVDFFEDGKEFQDMPLVSEFKIDLLFYTAFHDRYHRGHLSQIGYFYHALRGSI